MIKSFNLKRFLGLVALTLLPTLLIWLPFAFNLESFWGIPLPGRGMATVVANYDGPLFIVVAKTLYNVEQIKNLVSFPLSAQYYAAHYPLFPLFIRILAPIFGYPYSMIVVTLLSSILATYFFHKLATDMGNKKQALWLTVAFTLLPARWLIVKAVGSSEPLFLATTIASIYFFNKKKYLQSGVWGALAQLTRSAGILLFIAYGAYIFYQSFREIATLSTKSLIKRLKLAKYFPLLLIPAALAGLFVYYGYVFGDFFAYFNSGDNIHLFFPPFQIFNFSAPWVGTFWLEEIIFVYALIFLGFVNLVKHKSGVSSWYVGVFLLSLLFVSHRDLVRYSLPVVPFLIIGWRDQISKNEFKWLLLLLIVPLYLFSMVFISQNTMPVSDWAALL